jgi:protein-arginine deiminase
MWWAIGLAGALPSVALAGLQVQAGPLEHQVDTVVTITGATPGDLVSLVQGNGIGNGACYDFLDGDCFDVLDPLYLIGEDYADGSGRVQIPLTVPEPIGYDIALQAFTSRGWNGSRTELSPARSYIVQGPSAFEPEPEPEPDVAVSGDLFAPDLVIGTLNLDDDDRDGRPDWERGTNDSEAEPLDVETTPGGATMGLTEIRLTLTGDVRSIAVWDGSEFLLYGDTTSVTIPWRRDPSFDIEFGAPAARGTLRIEELDMRGDVVSSVRTDLLGSPLILSHHLQPAETLYAVDVNSRWMNNQAMIRTMREVLGSRFVAVPQPYDEDVWMQDEFEFAHAISGSGRTVDIVIDSIRDRGLDDYAEYSLMNANTGVAVFGSGVASSEDSFGNLETTPPLRAYGTDYPLGRVYWGDGGGASREPHPDLIDALERSAVQAPFAVDTSWLCVGHVDEFMSFVPDPSAPKGFRLVFTNTDLGMDLIDSVPRSMPLPRYAGYQTGHGYASAGEIQADRSLRAYNDDLQDLVLRPILDKLRSELDLDAADILEVPAVFEPVYGCGDLAGALVPGMVNFAVFTGSRNERTKVFIPDPFFRADIYSQRDDVFIDAFNQLLPPSLDLYYVDDWDTYHLMQGEVHCGSNTRRSPPNATWWKDAAHLMGGL